MPSATSQVHLRRDYVREGIVSHHDYYSQFVTSDTVERVTAWFGIEALTAALAEGEHFNAIAIQRWDALAIHEIDYPQGQVRSRGAFRAGIPLDRAAAHAAGETITRATLICIAKCAAHIALNRRAEPLVA